MPLFFPVCILSFLFWFVLCLKSSNKMRPPYCWQSVEENTGEIIKHKHDLNHMQGPCIMCLTQTCNIVSPCPLSPLYTQSQDQILCYFKNVRNRPCPDNGLLAQATPLERALQCTSVSPHPLNIQCFRSGPVCVAHIALIERTIINWEKDYYSYRNTFCFSQNSLDVTSKPPYLS